MVTFLSNLIVLAGLLASCLVFVLLGLLCIFLTRIPGIAWKLPVVLLGALVSLLLIAVGWPPRFGLELTGGVSLVYELDVARDKPVAVDMDRLIAAISRRVNPGGDREVTIREFRTDQVEIVMPTAERAELDRIKSIITNLGSLEFRILATERTDRNLIERAKQSDADTLYDGTAARKRLAWWVPVSKKEEAEFRRGGDIATRPDPNNADILQVLVLQDLFNVDGRYLAGARRGVDQYTGRPCIEFMFDSKGAMLFSGLTGNNLPDEVTQFARRLGIILNGEMFSAPNIHSVISDRGEITGDFTQQEVEDIVSVLNAGSLPCPLQPEPVSEMTFGANLAAARSLGVLAAVGIGVLILGQLLLVLGYRLVGLAAAVAWMVQVLALVGMFLLLRATLTVPSLCCLLLVLVLAAGCNLLVCALVRAQRRHEAEPATAVRSGLRDGWVPVLALWSLAWAAAVPLYVAGTDLARGIGFVLAAGSLAGLFTSLFCLPVLLEAVGRLVRSMGPSAARFFFPGTPAAADPPRLDPPPTVS